MREEADKCERKFLDVLNDRHNIILDAFVRVKSSIEDEFLKIRSKKKIMYPMKD